MTQIEQFKIEQFKAEIESELSLCERGDAYNEGRWAELNHMKMFIESMELEEAHQEKLRFLAETHAPKIKGWVARDKGAKSCCFYFNKPIRHTISWMDEIGETGVYNDDYVFLSDLHLDIEDLKWEDEPIEVELEIHRV